MQHSLRLLVAEVSQSCMTLSAGAAAKHTTHIHIAQAHVVRALMMHHSLQAVYECTTKHVKGTFQALHGEHPKTHRLLFFHGNPCILQHA